VRAMERGTVSAGRDPLTGKDRVPSLELVRLTIPRRVYTQSHIDYVAEVVIAVAERRDQLRGYRIVESPSVLRHFTARFAQM